MKKMFWSDILMQYFFKYLFGTFRSTKSMNLLKYLNFYISKEFRSGRNFDIEICWSNAEPIYIVLR